MIIVGAHPDHDGMAPRGAPEHIQKSISRQAVTELSPLQAEIHALIKSSGPMPVWRYMELCLTHPEHGYYVSRDPLGREGDFTTAPEVSQMFGELLGLWTASVWKAIGSPPTLRLIELGPGRGTMMADALRAIRVLPPLYQALHDPSGRDQSRAAREAAGDAVRRAAISPGMTASTTCRRARDHSRQRIFRRAADPSGGQTRDRLARARRQARCRWQAGIRRARTIRCRASRCCCRRWCARPLSAPCSNGGPIPR